MANMPETKTGYVPSSFLLDPIAAGIYLGGEEKPLSVLTLCDWRTRRVGPPWVRVGRLIRYRQADLDAWLESRVQKGAA